ncbi:glucosaminidase domain-containing protein [Cohnella sp. 56]|uniref:glucosaminidase domain-containing protein n=1 Tax=Cohnella sp. 56 TaxID=3113722 RepID=UPI0030E8BA6D
MRGDKKRFPLVLLIVVTMFATLGLTSFADLKQSAPAAVAAPAPAPSYAADPSDVPVPPSDTTFPPQLSSLSSQPPAEASVESISPVSDTPSVLRSGSLPEEIKKGMLRFTPDSEPGDGADPASPDEDDQADGTAPASDADAADGADGGANADIHKPDSAIYEVTAYYLNVRTNPYNGSKVQRVVSQGTRLEVLSLTDNGWLKLKDGGYVHGGYAKLLDDPDGGPPALSPAQPEDGAVQLDVPGAKPDDPLPQDGSAAGSDSSTDTDSEPASPTNRVASDSGLTEAHIAKLFKGTALAGHGIESVVLEIEEEYGINALFTIAVMKLESGNGKSRLSRTKNNLFGLNATSSADSKAFSFKSKGESVRKFGQLLSDKYVDKGYTTVDKVAQKYCPASSSWAGKVMNIMKSDYRKL